MMNKKITIQFVLLTFCIAYAVSGILIFLGQYGYRVHNWVTHMQQLMMNIPFAIYILSPAIASYVISRKHQLIKNFQEWLKTVFYFRNSPFSYLFVLAGVAIYFLVHVLVSGTLEVSLPFYTIILSLPGNLIIGGLEEAGWMYLLQPELDKKYGYVVSCVYTGFIWILWHIPLFFIAGTNHGDGLINFWMFNIQLMAFRFFNGAIYKISGKGCIFMCVLFHTLFNATSPVFGTMTMTWTGTFAANTTMILLSFAVIRLYEKKQSVHVME